MKNQVLLNVKDGHITYHRPPKADYKKELFAPVNWDAASLFSPDDSMMYLDLTWEMALVSAPYGAHFRCYYAPDGIMLHRWKLSLFEVQKGKDFRGLPCRVYIGLETASFEQNIWGLSWTQINK